ncbi:hypothetical protein [Mucilaginibacter pocheonensis]|uniref:PASTA domain-containing protein n=1 Tax=Mucilaginibacter pocheonensis TaxID=398050 RepID=A0ABU1TCE7_9SPHI|nr:hypothetical protein [Mucilaginibacter pocheonensis]MDR6943013.1 hypothetical protein [Mucilaginibacter pocheonensis]
MPQGIGVQKIKFGCHETLRPLSAIFFSLFADQKISAQIKEIKSSADLPVASFSVTNLAASDSASVGPQPGLLPGTWLQIYVPEKVPFIKP